MTMQRLSTWWIVSEFEVVESNSQLISIPCLSIKLGPRLVSVPREGSPFLCKYLPYLCLFRETKCQAAGTGCPQGMVGSSDVDCNLNYPNWGIAPVPKMPVDCPKGKYACVEYAERSKKRTLDGLATSCQDINQACPPGYDGFSTTSFKGIWPNKRVQPAPKDCPKSEYCCLEPPWVDSNYTTNIIKKKDEADSWDDLRRMSQSYPNAWVLQ